MTQKELLQLIADYMVENGITYLDASLDLSNNEVTFYIEPDNMGYKTNFTC